MAARHNSWAWTGVGSDIRERSDRVREIESQTAEQRLRASLAQAPAPRPEPVIEKPTLPYIPIKYDPVSAPLNGYTPDQIREYSELASLVGVSPADLKVEEFKAYLSTVDFPVYDLVTVIAFMDDKSKAEGMGWGWNWVPLRQKDRISASFGQHATRREPMWSSIGGSQQWTGEDRPASDSYRSARHIGNGQMAETAAYDKVVPLHALKKIAKIEKEFKGDVAFMVSDYAPAPAFKADPFLMAVVSNSRLNIGEGRFVIDVWDEPGFGIDKMLKSGL